MGATAYPTRDFAIDGYTGTIVEAWAPAGGTRELGRELGRLLDPAAAEATLHWGRNYIYRARLATRDGELPVAVKQFPNDGWRQRLRRRLSGSKAQKSWRIARAMRVAGIDTPEPVLLAESKRGDGPSYYVCRHLDGVFEARYLFRALHEGRERELFPHVDVGRFLDVLGATIRRLHDAGFWHRDLSSGNVLVHWPVAGEGAAPDGEGTGGLRQPRLYLVDLNRARAGGRPATSRRTRDLCRLMIFRPEHQRRFLAAYWGTRPEELGLRWHLYRLYHRAFLAKNETKKRVRQGGRRLKGLVLSRGTHGHIPAAPAEAELRDRVVWDHLSDQPHLHAGRWEKLATRVRDVGSHLSQARALAGALPRVRRRYRELRRELYRQPVPFTGAGVAVRPAAEPEEDAALLAAVEELGVRHLLLRLHPWQREHDREEALARSLAERGFELAFTLPQNRELVRDHLAGGSRWTEAVEELGRRFSPYGRAFQVGQAINRSKWGVWNQSEYASLARTADEILRRYEGVEVLGPAVIDFELHVTMAVVNARDLGIRFDALASLLYVDRRGAPENRQLGFDSVDKVALLQAIADTARNCAGRSWITEVNWPLWEGPHSPAGKSVSVSEETQADYLVRFYLLALATGMVERVYWWQLVAQGYGLIAPNGEEPRRRPAYHAFAHLLRRLEGGLCHGPLPTEPPARLYRFTHGEGGETIIVGWSTGGPVSVELPGPPRAVLGRDGEELPLPDGETVELTPSPRYFLV